MIKEELEKFVPCCEQEEKDKETALKYMNDFDDVLTRNNEYAHYCSSAFVLNESHDKVLMIYHNIYDSWAWPGGHADGESDLYNVALREVIEETSIENIKPIVKEMFAFDILPVKGHVKRGKYVSAHVHLSATYLFEASENDLLKIKEDENNGVKWIDIDKVVESSSEPHMKSVYQKIIDKIKREL